MGDDGRHLVGLRLRWAHKRVSVSLCRYIQFYSIKLFHILFIFHPEAELLEYASQSNQVIAEPPPPYTPFPQFVDPYNVGYDQVDSDGSGQHPNFGTSLDTYGSVCTYSTGLSQVWYLHIFDRARRSVIIAF